MSPLTEFLELICDTIDEKCGLEHEVSLKELSKEGGIYAELGSGFVDTRYYNKDEIVTVPVLFLCRNANQKQGLDELSSICSYLRKLKTYPDGNTFKWVDTTVSKEPNKIARDEDGTYHFSCILNCKIIF